MSRRLRALGCFIFAGGFTVGVSKHFDILAHLEGSPPYGASTAQANFPDLPIYYGPDRWPIQQLKALPTIDFIYGNPPCAAWSGNNPRSHDPDSWKVDARVNCTYQHFNLLEELRPKVWVWESVSQAPFKGRELVEELTERAMKLGYSVTQFFHDAQWLGTPQVRKRWFLICHKVGLHLRTPNWAPPMTAGEALSDVRSSDRTEIRQLYPNSGALKLADVRPGERLSHYWERTVGSVEGYTYNARGQVRGRPSFGMVRLRPDAPSTATVGYGMIHPTEDRFLTAAEVGVLAGFPPDYHYAAEGLEKLKLIARGVCPPVGSYLAREVAAALTLDDPVTSPTSTIVDYRFPTYTTAPERPKQERPSPMSRTATTAPQPVLPAPPAPEAGQGSGAYIRSLLTRGYGNQDILEAVHAHYPGSKAKGSDISWNRGKLRQTGGVEPPPTDRAPRATKPREPKKYDVPVADPAALGRVMDGALRRSVEAVEPAPPAQPDLMDRLPAAAAAAAQPTRRKTVERDAERPFDTTSLRAKVTGKLVHRDYAAHFFRWGFIGRVIHTDKSRVLDVGCGVDQALFHVLHQPRAYVPGRYVGVDLNPEPEGAQRASWAEFHWGFNFVDNYRKIKEEFDIVVCFEVIEHMKKEDGEALLRAMASKLAPGGRIYLSTPVFDGKAAANHIHEWSVSELAEAIGKVKKLRLVKRYGTFMSYREIKRSGTPSQLEVVNQLGEYYSPEVMACFLAPLFPDVSRNNVWVIELKG